MKHKRIKQRVQEIDIEHIFLDKLKQKQHNNPDIKIEVPLKRASFLLFLFLVVVVLGVFLSLVFKMQISQHEHYEALAQENKFVVAYFNSERGIIYDRNMRQLVWNEVGFDLWENQKLIKENLSHEELILFETNQNKPPGLKIQRRILRNYETQGGLSHILGYLGKLSAEEFKELSNYQFFDYIGRAGIESFYEEILREKKGAVQIERTAEGREISREIIKYPQSGDSLVISLDFELQKQIKESLQRTMNEVDSDRGVVIALQPSTGEVLAMVSLPVFDNNLFSKGISQEQWRILNEDESNPQLNRAIGGLYPTGSTIKPFVGVAALEEGIITESTSIYCPEKLCIENQFNPEEAECFPDWTFHGWSSIKRAIAESVNPFFYIIGGGYKAPSSQSAFFNPNLPRKFDGLGANKLAEYLQKFNLGARTGLDLPGEVAGRVPTPDWKESYFKTALSKKWYLGDTFNLSIGQGYLLTTPLQIAVAFSAIANNGVAFKPRFLKNFIDSETGAITEAEKQILIASSTSPETINIIKQGMRQAVSSGAGSAVRLNSLPVKVGAKTGTAQVYSGKEIYHNWIAVLAPYENTEIVLIVLIEEVEGARIAAQQVAKDVLQWYFSE